MERHRFLSFLAIMSMTLNSFLLFPPIHQLNSRLQQSNLITATGQFSDHGVHGTLNFDFDPNGGPINGSFSGIRDTDPNGILHLQGNLSGSFSGGDGGRINGSIHNTKWWWTSRSTGNAIDAPAGLTNEDLENWSGTLFLSGQGNGTIGGNGTWSVTFSATDFQTAIGETGESESTSENTIEPVPSATPTSFEVIGMTLNLLPETKAFIAASPNVNEATKAIFKQDAAIIVRDQNNQFYTVNNEGQSIALPLALNSYFRMSNQFAVLGNDNWLASSEHGSIRGTINGGGDFVLLNKIPGELKDHDYTMLATNCTTPTDCNPVMKINSTASSTKVFATCLMPPSDSSQTGMNPGGVYYVSSPGGKIASSEHGSCRGTINGGGDFIYEPQPVIMASYIRPSDAKTQNSASPGYLGVLVENRSDGAEVQQIQDGSPASMAGLEIGDLIANVSGTPLDEQYTLGSVLAQFSGGDEVILGIIRNDQVSAINLTLATMTAPVIETPSAMITLTDKTELVVDIGFNGVTGILVLADSAHVVEPVTGSNIDVPAGYAAIVIPGESLDTIYTMTDADVNKWWEEEFSTTNGTINSTQAAQPAEKTTSTKGYKDFNPIPGVDGVTLYWLGCLAAGFLLLIVWIINLVKK